MKKYRPTKLHWLCVPIFLVIMYAAIFLAPNDGPYRPILILCGVFFFGLIITNTAYFVQFEEDRVIVRQKAHSETMNTGSALKARTILYQDISSLKVSYTEMSVAITLKDGSDFCYIFTVYPKAREILDKFTEIKCG